MASPNLKRIVTALERRDFRLFLAGSFLSNIGSYIQAVAQAWLVLQLTNSPFYLGLDGFAATLPIAIFAFWGGIIADRVNRRELLIRTQWVLFALAAILGVLTQFKVVHVWEVLVFSFCTGLTQALSWPVYQAVIANLVPQKELSNAIALNSTQFNMARILGPLIGAFGLTAFGTAGCFYVNAVSFMAVVVVLSRIEVPDRRVTQQPLPSGAEDRRQHPTFRESFQEGFAYMRSQRGLYWLLLLIGASSILGLPLVMLLPVFARDILHIGASGYGVLMGAFGAGAVLSGMLIAFLGDFPGKGKFVIGAVFLYAFGMIGFSVSRDLLVSLICLFFCGFAMVGFASTLNTMVQADVPERLRGRAMSLFIFCFGGCIPFGNLLAGFLAKHLSSPLTLILQGSLLGLFTLYVNFAHREIRSL